MRGIEQIKWLTVSLTALHLGVSRQRVYQLIYEGSLASVKLGSTVLVSRLSVEHRKMAGQKVKDIDG